MILPRYRIGTSLIPGAGNGVFLAEPVAAGRIVIAPDAIDSVCRYEDILARPDREAALAASVRWFEDRFTVSDDWPDECFVNHSFEPNGLWHLGFVFALTALAPGDELCVDYRHLLGEGQAEPYRDARTGQAIVGLPWRDSPGQIRGRRDGTARRRRVVVDDVARGVGAAAVAAHRVMHAVLRAAVLDPHVRQAIEGERDVAAPAVGQADAGLDLVAVLPAGAEGPWSAAFLFSLIHYVGPYGDPFQLASFTFRFVAGVFFSGLFVLRGFDSLTSFSESERARRKKSSASACCSMPLANSLNFRSGFLR